MSRITVFFDSASLVLVDPSNRKFTPVQKGLAWAITIICGVTSFGTAQIVSGIWRLIQHVQEPNDTHAMIAELFQTKTPQKASSQQPDFQKNNDSSNPIQDNPLDTSTTQTQETQQIVNEPADLTEEITHLIEKATTYINDQLQLTEEQRHSLLEDFNSLKPTPEENENKALLQERKTQLQEMQRTLKPFLEGTINREPLPAFPEYDPPPRDGILRFVQFFYLSPFEYLLYRPIKVRQPRRQQGPQIRQSETPLDIQLRLKKLMLQFKEGKVPEANKAYLLSVTKDEITDLNDFHTYIMGPLWPKAFFTHKVLYKNADTTKTINGLIIVDEYRANGYLLIEKDQKWYKINSNGWSWPDAQESYRIALTWSKAPVQ